MRNAPASLPVQIIRAAAADGLMRDARFVDEWSALCAACPWATGFQSPQFVLAWMTAYRARIEPILVISRDAGGRLCGLLALARRDRGRLVVAGGGHAEYQVWLSDAGIGDAFAAAAMKALRRELPRSGLTFRYLPPQAPTKWVADSSIPSLMRVHTRPLLRIGEGSEIDQSLRKPGNRSKLNRLERLGGLEFRRVTDPQELEGLLEQIIDFYDLRQGAVYGADYFGIDVSKKPFHRALMRDGKLLHVTALFAGGELAAAHMGVLSGDELQLGIIVHNPRLAKQSPGKLHLLLLARLLREEGVAQFDLTPGGDPFKERLANAWDEVRTVAVFASARQRALAAVFGTARTAFKRMLRRWRITPATVEILGGELRRWATSPLATLRRSVRQIWRASHTDVYAGIARALCDRPSNVQRNRIADLLLYQPGRAGRPRRRFLLDAMNRFEAGQHCYTICTQHRLVAWAWMSDTPQNTPLAGRPDLHAADATFIHDIKAATATDLRHLLEAIQHDAAGRRLYVVVSAPTSATETCLLESGLRHHGTIAGRASQRGHRRDADAAGIDARPAMQTNVSPVHGEGRTPRQPQQRSNSFNRRSKEVSHV